jgi:hypothetical protein
VPRLALVGFSGIWLDRFGYGDRADETEAGLAEATGVAPVSSADGRRAFFAFPDLGGKLVRELGAERAQRARLLLLSPFEQRWEGGFNYLHGTGRHTTRSCGPRGRLVLENPLPQARRVELRTRFATLVGEGTLEVKGAGWSETMVIDRDSRALRRELAMAPLGTETVDFAYVQGSGQKPADSRDPLFLVVDFGLKEAY